MNPIERALTWIDILLDPSLNGGARPFRQGKHTKGYRRSPGAREERRERNRRERQARKATHKRMKV